MTHDAYELSQFFSGADLELKEKVLLELCRRNPDLMLDIIRTADCTVDVEELKYMVRDGRKIQAIKWYREMTPGIGLREAKDFIEALLL